MTVPKKRKDFGMPIDRSNFDEVTEADVLGLIDAGVPEGLQYEYKRQCYGNSDAAVKEALKDISSFANSSGGHLVIGMEEEHGIPTVMVGLDGINVDLEIQRLESLIRDGIEPRIFGVRFRAITLKNDRKAIIIRVSKSWNPPHRVSARNSNRFYLRNSNGVHEASVEELRILFNVAATVEEKIRTFRAGRLSLISAGEGAVRIEGDGRLILHIVPMSAFGLREQLSVAKIFDAHASFPPLSQGMGMTAEINFDGFVNFRGGKQCYGYTQVFRNGIIEATKAGMVHRHETTYKNILYSSDVESSIFSSLPTYLNGLKSLSVPTPLVIMLTLTGIGGAHWFVNHESFLLDNPKPFTRDTLSLPEVIIDNFSDAEDFQRKMRPAIDALWNAAGYFNSINFNEDGIWIRPRNS